MSRFVYLVRLYHKRLFLAQILAILQNFEIEIQSNLDKPATPGTKRRWRTKFVPFSNVTQILFRNFFFSNFFLFLFDFFFSNSKEKRINSRKMRFVSKASTLQTFHITFADYSLCFSNLEWKNP